MLTIAPNVAAPDALERLASELESRLGLVPHPKLETLLELAASEQATPGFTVVRGAAPGLRFQRHHEVRPALVIYDPVLGTVGFVEYIGRGVTLHEQDLQTYIDRAAYVRQLALLEAQRTKTHPLTVEVVIVLDHEQAAHGVELFGPLVRRLAKETGYFRALGVSLLVQRPHGGYDEPDLRRAFAWLLTVTRTWYGSRRVKESTDEALPPEKWVVSLQDYRLSGLRQYEFAADISCHLLHGYNGSGKSTLTEAIELLLTNRVERLERPERGESDPQTAYFPIVRNHRHGQSRESERTAAVVTLSRDRNQQDVIAEVRVEPQAPPPGPDVVGDRRIKWARKGPRVTFATAASFRLDQVLMDTLVRGTDVERATLFLRAFFPDDRSTFDRLAEASRAAHAAWDALPPRVQQQVTSPAGRAEFLRRHDWLQEPRSTWPSGLLSTIDPCLPIPVTDIEALAWLHPSIPSLLAGWRERPQEVGDLEKALASLDRMIDEVRKRLTEVRPQLQRAKKVLDEFGNWRAATARASRGRDFAADLNKWLELTALADLVAKYHDVVATLAEARAAGWQPPEQYRALFENVREGQDRLDFLRDCRDALASARGAALAAVKDWSVAGQAADAQTPEQASHPPRLHLLEDEIASLNQICAWLPSLSDEPSVPRLGDLFTDALREEQVRTRGRCTLGLPGGLEAAAAETQRLLDACATLEQNAARLSDAFALCRTARQAFTLLGDRERLASKSFFAQMTSTAQQTYPINAALNELLALFKPATWAYQDVSLRAEHRGAGASRETLGIRAIDKDDDVAAELRLNTAEMNTFTLALFLLCAPALSNPLRLLVLDDPLQNMDEMTVSSLARGLGKLIRIFPPGWRIVALFHGEEDLHRVRSEVPCAVYRLPWLSPSTAGDVPPIVPEDLESNWGRPVQKLSELAIVEPPD